MLFESLEKKGPLVSTHIGEPLVEVAPLKAGRFFGRSITALGGDCLNAACKLNAILQLEDKNAAQVALCAVLGLNDPASQHTLKYLRESGMNLDFIRTQEGRSMGLYIANTNSDGTKDFSFHGRETSAARLLFQLPDSEAFLQGLLEKSDIVSSSLLAATILEGESDDRAKMIELFQNAQTKGTGTIFDTNYRMSLEHMWGAKSKKEAQDFLRKIAGHSHLVLPGDEDMINIFGFPKDSYVDPTLEFFAQAGTANLILKCGENGYVIASELSSGQYKNVKHVKVEPLHTFPGDTTAAGDFFNAGVIAAMILNRDASLFDMGRKGHTAAIEALQEIGTGIGQPRYGFVKRMLASLADKYL